jgi:hypothetical protein
VIELEEVLVGLLAVGASDLVAVNVLKHRLTTSRNTNIETVPADLLPTVRSCFVLRETGQVLPGVAVTAALLFSDKFVSISYTLAEPLTSSFCSMMSLTEQPALSSFSSNLLLREEVAHSDVEELGRARQMSELKTVGRPAHGATTAHLLAETLDELRVALLLQRSIAGSRLGDAPLRSGCLLRGVLLHRGRSTGRHRNTLLDVTSQGMSQLEKSGNCSASWSWRLEVRATSEGDRVRAGPVSTSTTKMSMPGSMQTPASSQRRRCRTSFEPGSPSGPTATVEVQ